MWRAQGESLWAEENAALKDISEIKSKVADKDSCDELNTGEVGFFPGNHHDGNFFSDD